MTQPLGELLLAFAHKPDEANFQPLYDHTKSRVWTLCVRILGDEADAQDAFQ
jgi:DNA-directed RNA polymerase specialized sigma24 family protein